MTGLEDLPVELLYEVHLYSLSTALPITSRRLYTIFNAAPPSYRAQYILSHFEPDEARLSDVVSKILRDPLPTFLALWRPARTLRDGRTPTAPTNSSRPRAPAAPLPRARAADRPAVHRRRRPPAAAALPVRLPRIAPPNANSHEGYALTRAVHAEFVPLVRLLLAHGASPAHKRGLAVLVAVRQKKLPLVRMLVERAEAGGGRGAKKRRLEDRVEVTKEMLKAAVKAKARDIAEYFMQEKGCVPDIQTLQMLMR
ncbi:hypothetical protein B0H14DRAFT_3421872 [Mycena olivaceomarginata]|nr:hypothetical protein B0H14DRAFT_3421872 [Mycena olivaceomarginata]